jgi:hypothetical protein
MTRSSCPESDLWGRALTHGLADATGHRGFALCYRVLLYMYCYVKRRIQINDAVARMFALLSSLSSFSLT